VQNLDGEEAEKAGLTVIRVILSVPQLYLNCSSKSPWISSKQTTDKLLLKVWNITRKNNALQSIILEVVLHTFLKKNTKTRQVLSSMSVNSTTPLGTCRLIFLHCVAHSLTFAVSSPFRSSFKLFFCSISTWQRKKRENICSEKRKQKIQKSSLVVVRVLLS